MDQIFDLWHKSQTANQIALDQTGRNPYPTLGIVTENDDPEKQRRIKIADPAAPQVNSHWLQRLCIAPEHDYPVPRIGDTVLVFWPDGSNTVGFYLSLNNAPNPPLDKKDPLIDRGVNIPGNSVDTVGQNRDEKTTDNHRVYAGLDYRVTNGAGSMFEVSYAGRITEQAVTDNIKTAAMNFLISNNAGVSVNLLANGALMLTASGATIILGGAGKIPGITSNFYMKLPSNAQWDFNGQSLNIVNAAGMSINGKQVAVVGAVDSDSDVVVNRGY